LVEQEMSAIFGVRYSCLDCGVGFAGETAALLHTLEIAHFDFSDTERAGAIYVPFHDPEFGISLSPDDLPLKSLPPNLFSLKWNNLSG
jgi:hypothetical protein